MVFYARCGGVILLLLILKLLFLLLLLQYYYFLLFLLILLIYLKGEINEEASRSRALGTLMDGHVTHIERTEEKIDRVREMENIQTEVSIQAPGGGEGTD